MTCDELCHDNGCWYEGDGECTSGDTESCVCDNSYYGLRSCDAEGAWGECTGCTAQCGEGERAVCACPGGGNGLQLCSEGAWGTCDGCVAACTEGSSQRCLCAGGLEGSQSCTGGAWTTCTDCATPTVCTEGEEEDCSCFTGDGTRSCVSGVWGACEGCSAWIYGDIDFGTQGMTIGGTQLEVVDTVDWGCDPMTPGDDNLIWLLNTNDGIATQTRYFEFDLPMTATDVLFDFWHVSTTNGDTDSELEVIINGISHGETFEATDRCPEVHIGQAYDDSSLIFGGTNYVEVWTRNNALELHHGFQGLHVEYTFSE